ncbi:glycosyltransferase family 2 protein [Mucilaginibacter arboris]|uniref:Glycosyltransferase n=1 Tax=Mucilaginibacter arboris TaxID=2682090 RepID=A0A7K1SZ66_9SPHI|nr:glycosyltransferase family 2 protein [Mucilaginibacter arboris]MVN22616.1 glycosyltransferase [Mucilaginibacter arboris]
MIFFFWFSLFLIFYAFVGYGLVLFFLVKLRQFFIGKRSINAGVENALPSCTLIVAAYNEEDFIEEKIKNTLALNYPADKIRFMFVTDGSTDKTPEIISHYPQIKLMHVAKRKGKIAAVQRAVAAVTTEVMVFTDANTFLNPDALIKLCRHYADPKVGAVAGEKRVQIDETSDATAGEGFYWKYESKLKVWDSELNSVVGAAGELFSVKTVLYEAVHPDSIIDDFMISMLIAKKGYRIVYEPEAYATETSSANIKEELKRKIRIAAGGLQSIIWLKSLLLPFKQPLLSFQYISHRVLRWTVVPFLMIASLILNFFIVAQTHLLIYQLILTAQVLFYTLALLGWLMEKQQIKIKALFIPYYFGMMNYAIMAGIFRYLFGEQSAAWEKSKRK